MTNAEARFNNSLRPWKPEGSLGRTAQGGHLDSHTAPELSDVIQTESGYILTRLDMMGMSSVEVALLLVTSVTAAVM